MNEQYQQIIKPEDRLPEVGTWVIVVTQSYRCMAYLGRDGKWRDVQRKRELDGVLGWCPMESKDRRTE